MTKQVVKRNYSKINTLLNNAGLFRQLSLLYWNKMMSFIIIIFFFNSKFENTFCLSPFGRCPSACCIVFFITIHFLRCIGVKAFQRSEALGTTPHNFISPAAISSFWLVCLFFFFFEVGAHVSQLDAFRRFVLRLGSKLSAIKETKKKNNKTV